MHIILSDYQIIVLFIQGLIVTILSAIPLEPKMIELVSKSLPMSLRRFNAVCVCVRACVCVCARACVITVLSAVRFYHTLLIFLTCRHNLILSSCNYTVINLLVENIF